MKLSNLILLTAVLSIALFAKGCDGLLDAEPQQSISEDIALGTSQNVENALVGGYALMAGGTQFGGQWFYLPELLADSGELTWSGTFFPQQDIWLKQQETDNSVATNTWTNAYNTINRVNNVLSALDVVDEAIRDRVEGEAKFIRGTVYYYLVNLYSKTWGDGDNSSNPGVPLITTPTQGGIDETANVPRATVQQVYDQLIQDLTDAKNLLPPTNGVFATTYAASAILSRVHLTRHEYAAARDEASRIIESGLFSLVPAYAAAFNNDSNSAEDVFSIQITSQDGTNNMNTFYASTGFGGRGDIDVEAPHMELYEEGDDRLNQFYIDDTNARRTNKFNSPDANVPFIRLAEIHLTRAEANFREGTEIGMHPEDELNTVRARVGLAPVELTSVDQILHERRLELAFEGNRLFDIKRTRTDVGQYPWNADILVFPIPQREIDANPALQGQQNPGYN
jgi:starch-binding outer membrane protein, SusD/RagB family